MNIKAALDVVAVLWFLAFSYTTALGFLFGSIQALEPMALLSPLALIPSILWISWRIYNREGYMSPPTARQTIFLGGGIGLLALLEHFNFVEALSHLL